MAAVGAVARDAIEGFCVLGELALDGSIAAVAGALPAAIGADGLGKGLICPASCGAEAAWAAADMAIPAPADLLVLINHFKGLQTLRRPQPTADPGDEAMPDLKDIKGQETAKRALEVAAAGGHNLLMIGPPSAGKSMLARRLPSILPPLQPAEMLEVSMIRSVAGDLAGGRIGRTRPFRAPHHSASMAALVGGGTRPRPGEAALAHLGVLFLDELPEFHPQVLDALRQPLETGETVIARQKSPHLLPLAHPADRRDESLPLRPCRRAWLCLSAGTSVCRALPGASSRAQCSTVSIFRSRSWRSRPRTLVLPHASEGSAEVRTRVTAARRVQAERYAPLGLARVRTNADCDGALLEEIAEPEAAGLTLLRDAADALSLSARGYHRTLRVARTLADLDGEERVARIHVAEALSYRGPAPGASRGLSAIADGAKRLILCAIPTLSHRVRIGLLTGACYGRIGVAPQASLRR
jgi:magnesium chelatase family protein